MQSNSDKIIIIGGGLAGLTAAIHLLKEKKEIIIFEKNTYPKHKVCGEYISNEVLSYFDQLNIDIQCLKPTNITKTSISVSNGKTIHSTLPLGGFGISRYTLDNYLYEKVLELGGKFIHEQVVEINFEKDNFTIKTNDNQLFNAKVVLGAYGKRSNLDFSFDRNFIHQKSPWLGVKAHYQLDFPNDLVELHNFKGGYCGVSKVENDSVNICYLVKYDVFKKYKNIQDFQQNILYQNPKLKQILEKATLLFEKPLTISQISFENKNQVENHILMLGDTAGVIHPLCGNGMAMAIRSAKIASENSIYFLDNKINRFELEKNYIKEWNQHFKTRLLFGKILSKILLNNTLSNFMLNILMLFPKLLPIIIKKTHGKPI